MDIVHLMDYELSCFLQWAICDVRK